MQKNSANAHLISGATLKQQLKLSNRSDHETSFESQSNHESRRRVQKPNWYMSFSVFLCRNSEPFLAVMRCVSRRDSSTVTLSVALYLWRGFPRALMGCLAARRPTVHLRGGETRRSNGQRATKVAASVLLTARRRWVSVPLDADQSRLSGFQWQTGWCVKTFTQNTLLFYWYVYFT